MRALSSKSHGTISRVAVETTISVGSIAGRPISVSHPVEVGAGPSVADTQHIDRFASGVTERVVDLLSITRFAKQAAVLLAQHSVTTATCRSARAPIRAHVPVIGQAAKDIASLLTRWRSCARAQRSVNLLVLCIFASVDSGLNASSARQGACSPRIGDPTGPWAGGSIASLRARGLQGFGTQSRNSDDGGAHR